MSRFTSQPVSRQFSDLKQKTRKKLEAVVRDFTLEIHKKVVLASPIGDDTGSRYFVSPDYIPGTFVTNWLVSFNRKEDSLYPTVGKNAAEPFTLNAAKQAMTNYELGDTVFITNNTPYAQNVEYEGWSFTGPYEPLQSLLNENLQGLLDSIVIRYFQ